MKEIQHLENRIYVGLIVHSIIDPVRTVCGARVYETTVRPSVGLSVQSCDHMACGGFAAERRVGGRYRSIASAPGVHQQWRRSRGRSTPLSSICEQCHVYS